MKFEISTPLGFTVRTSKDYWQRLIIKHPDIEELEDFVQLALSAPDEVRRSSRDAGVLLFYPGTARRTLGCCSSAAFKWGWFFNYCLPN